MPESTDAHSQRLALFQGVVRGELSCAQAALLLGVPEQEVQACCDILRAQPRRQKARLPTRWRLALAALAAGALGVVAEPALAQSTCTSTLPSPLKTFCPGAPAVAADVNGNFATLANVLIQKTGPLTEPSLVTNSAISTTGTLSASGQMSTGGNLLVSGTASAAALKTRTVKAVPTDSVTLPAGGYRQVPGLSASVTLNTPTTVVVSYALSMVSMGGAGYLVTRLMSSSAEVLEGRRAVGDTLYFDNAANVVLELPAGTHTFWVEYRNSVGVRHDASVDYQMRSLSIHVLGR